MEDISIFINIRHTNSIQFLNLHGFLCRFWLCPSIYILKINEKNWLDHQGRQSAHAQETIHILQSLGWTINWKKSLLEPSYILEFLCLHFNLEQALISPNKSFLETHTSLICLHQPSCLLTRSFRSTAESHTKACSFHSPRTTSAPFSPVLDKTTLVPTCSTVGQSIPTESRTYFTSPLVLQSGSTTGSSAPHSRIQPLLLHGCLSDGLGSQLARTTNYGTVVAARATTTHKLSGTGSRPLGHLSLGPQWFQQTVCVYCDKSTAVAYIRKQRGMHSLSLFHKTLELFQLLDKFAIILVHTHLQGARSNVTADALSRLDSPSPTEWRLPLGTLNSLFFAFRTPLMDMFATVENKVTPIYVSPYPTTVLGQ